jgi:hypothetical protein
VLFLKTIVHARPVDESARELFNRHWRAVGFQFHPHRWEVLCKVRLYKSGRINLAGRYKVGVEKSDTGRQLVEENYATEPTMNTVALVAVTIACPHAMEKDGCKPNPPRRTLDPGIFVHRPYDRYRARTSRASLLQRFPRHPRQYQSVPMRGSTSDPSIHSRGENSVNPKPGRLATETKLTALSS